jgi:thymidylate kinase
MKARVTRSLATISFSGVDGAGKSTQIDQLQRQLEARGVRVRVLRFWDDIAALTWLREGAGHRVFKGEKGIGRPEAPINRRDKNVRGWWMTALRIFLYLLDALSLRNAFRCARRSEGDFIIFDRYLYDELANLDLNRGMIRAYARFLLKIVPKPDISVVLDAEPEAARARKPEYPLDFIRFNREAYLNLSRLFDGITVLSPMTIADAHQEVLMRSLMLLELQSGNGKSLELEETSTTHPRPAIF